ncbi:MAG: hypothetical protein IKT56_01015 [Clostridia bacterium]|nr:hypothetical protein [Clostridia bacterium]
MPGVLMEEKMIDNPIIEGDFLNRHGFITQVKNVIEVLSRNEKNGCFAISGCWGIGKSYVLDKLKKQLLFEQDQERASDNYFVFHFNCWEYDYYEEPLIAIVSAMLDEITTNENLFTETAREHIRSAAKLILSKIYEVGSKWLEAQTGVNPKNMTDALSEIHNDATTKISEAHQYDEYLNFKQVLSTLRDKIGKIAAERTVIFVVDELDRCIPEYQIKVLERLHHVFNGIDNMQVVLAVDKAQLERTIQKMFGEKVDTQKYLAKFIKFEIELDEGTYSRQFEELLGYYFDQFRDTTDPLIAEFKENIFSGITIREKIEIIEKCHLLHNLLNRDDEKMFAEIMCIELFLAVVSHTKAQLQDNKNFVDFSGMFGPECTQGLKFLREKMSCRTRNFGEGEENLYCVSDGGRTYIRTSDLWGILLGSYTIFANIEIAGFLNSNNIIDYVKDYTRQFCNLLKTIK